LYAATTKVASLGRFAGRLADRLPGVATWAAGRAVPQPSGQRFRDRWQRGDV
jgi:hypothetical protein